MRLARRTLLASMIAATAAPAVLRLARAGAPQVTLKLHHFFSAVSSGHDKFLAPWARKVGAESGGRIRIDIFPSMELGGAPAQLLDQVRDGTADIVWAAPGNTPGRFAKIEVFELPFVPSRRALVNSKAIEDYAAANLQDEFREVRPLSFSCRDRAAVHANRTIRSIADLKGLRLHVTNRLAGEAVRALGAYGVSAPIPQVPMSITGHVIDGCLDPWDVVPALKLHDLLKTHADFAESSLSTETFVLAMNKTAYERLPRELKAIIDNNSGQFAASMAGTMWDLEAKAVADMVRERGDPITMLTAEEVAHGRKATEAVIAAWLKEMKARKVDGNKLIAGARDLLEKYADEPEPQPPQPAQSSQPSERKVAAQPQQPIQPPEPKVAAEPQPPAPQAKAVATEMPKVNAPASTPVTKRVPPKELDIPL
jgi:TRAP-type C4-dicarboxylate transport system substrate-binding protein